MTTKGVAASPSQRRERQDKDLAGVIRQAKNRAEGDMLVAAGVRRVASILQSYHTARRNAASTAGIFALPAQLESFEAWLAVSLNSDYRVVLDMSRLKNVLSGDFIGRFPFTDHESWPVVREQWLPRLQKICDGIRNDPVMRQRPPLELKTNDQPGFFSFSIQFKLD